MTETVDDAEIGYDITVEVRSGPATSDGYVELGLMMDINPPEDSVDQIDVTHMKSPGKRKQNISGLIDGGEGSFELIWAPGKQTDKFCAAWRSSGENRDVRITYPNGASEEWPATYRSFSRKAPLGDKLTGTLTVKQAGDPTYTDATS